MNKNIRQPTHQTYRSFHDILFQITRYLKKKVGLLFAAIVASTLLARLSTRFWNVLRIFSHSSRRAFGCWTKGSGLQCPFQFFPEVFYRVEVRPAEFFQPNLMQLALCTGAQSCCQRKDFHQTFPTRCHSHSVTFYAR